MKVGDKEERGKGNGKWRQRHRGKERDQKRSKERQQRKVGERKEVEKQGNRKGCGTRVVGGRTRRESGRGVGTHRKKGQRAKKGEREREKKGWEVVW